MLCIHYEVPRPNADLNFKALWQNLRVASMCVDGKSISSGRTVSVMCQRPFVLSAACVISAALL